MPKPSVQSCMADSKKMLTILKAHSTSSLVESQNSSGDDDAKTLQA